MRWNAWRELSGPFSRSAGVSFEQPRRVPVSSREPSTAILKIAKTRIIATLGPASESIEVLRSLILEGVDVFRLNFAHGTHAWLSELVRRIRQVYAELERPIGIRNINKTRIFTFHRWGKNSSDNSRELSPSYRVIRAESSIRIPFENPPCG